MKLIALSILAASFLIASGCGGSSSSNSTTGTESHLRSELRSIGRELHDSPQSRAYETALGSLDETAHLSTLRTGIENLLPKMTTYVRYLRSLPFPPCVRSAQRRLVRLLGESEAMTRGALPVIRKGNSDLAKAYLTRVGELSKRNNEDFETYQRQEIKLAEEGGNGHC